MMRRLLVLMIVAVLRNGEDRLASAIALETAHRLEGMHPNHREQGDEANQDAGSMFHERED